jgi:tripartite-type tricarboxylate transporter receptor subunit TctC
MTKEIEPARRSLLRAGLALASTASLYPGLSFGQGAYPSRPIRVLIGTPPGDTADGWTRLLTQGMPALLGQSIIVDNRPGAHGMIVGGLAKNAAPDGYTLLVSTGGPMSINPGLYKEKLSYDPVKDFVPIAPVLRGPLFLYANNDVPVKNLKEMIAYVKERPGKISYGSGGTGTTQHLSMELLKRAAGIEMTHVPYRGSPMVLQDVIGGQIPFAFDAGGSLLPQVRNGKVRLLGVTSTQRFAAMPDVQTLAEQGLTNFETRVWMGLFAPAGTPPDVVARLNEVVTKVASTPEFAARLAPIAAEPWIGSSDDLRKFVVADIAKWTAVIKQAGVQAE